MTERERQAAEVIFSLNPSYIPADCCVDCGVPVFTYRAATMSKSGDRKGICVKCGTSYPEMGHYCPDGLRVRLEAIQRGDYD